MKITQSALARITRRLFPRPTRRVQKFLNPIGLEALEQRIAPATIIVNTVADTVAVDGKVSLREAILSANNNGPINADVVAAGAYGADLIKFNIPGAAPHTINAGSQLPTLTDPKGVTIDATSEPGYAGKPVIELKMAPSSPPDNAAIVITSPNNTVKGLAINEFSHSGIVISGTAAKNNLIAGNYIGTNLAGTAPAPGISRAAYGLEIVMGASQNIIGGTTPALRNVVAGSEGGLLILGDGNSILGNYFGTDATGTAAIAGSLAAAM